MNRVLRRLVETEREAQDPANHAKVELNPRNYDFTSLEHLATSDGCAYTLSVQPKIPSKFLYRGRIWVNEKDFAVCRIEAEPAQNPSMWITKTDILHAYQKDRRLLASLGKPEHFDSAPERPRYTDH